MNGSGPAALDDGTTDAATTPDRKERTMTSVEPTGDAGWREPDYFTDYTDEWVTALARKVEREHQTAQENYAKQCAELEALPGLVAAYRAARAHAERANTLAAWIDAAAASNAVSRGAEWSAHLDFWDDAARANEAHTLLFDLAVAQVLRGEFTGWPPFSGDEWEDRQEDIAEALVRAGIHKRTRGGWKVRKRAKALADSLDWGPLYAPWEPGGQFWDPTFCPECRYNRGGSRHCDPCWIDWDERGVASPSLVRPVGSER